LRRLEGLSSWLGIGARPVPDEVDAPIFLIDESLVRYVTGLRRV